MDIERLTEELLSHQQHQKVLTDTISEIKKVLEAEIIENGDENEKGHQFLPAGKFLLQRQRRQGKSTLNHDRVELWARERGIWDDISKTITVVDEDALVGYIFQNRDDPNIEEEFQNLHDTPPPTYAFMKPQIEEQYDY